MKPTISKSQYVKGCQCSKALWFSLNRKDLTPPFDAVKQAIFDAGNEVGEWAKKRFPGGVEVKVPYYKTQEGTGATAALIAAGHNTIFEATAIHAQDGTHARIDILRKAPGADAWDMIEVKGSSSVKDYHHDDMSFQYRVFTGAGYRINRCFMMVIDNQYVRDGEIDPQRLFKLEDITAIVLAKQPEVGGAVPALKTTLDGKDEPQEKIGARCFKPFDCDYIGHCWQGIPDYSIYNVFSGKKADEMVESLGSYEVKSIPAQAIPGGVKGKDVRSYTSGETYAEPDNIRGFLERLKYPLYYLDYETVGSAIPLFNGTRPFQAVPFQFSLHIEDSPGAELRHHTFLHQNHKDPRPDFIEALIRLCGSDGSVIVYNQSFEEGVNEALILAYPAVSAEIAAINARMVDLLVPFQKRWLYHPSQNGSATIKKVLPAFTDLSYDGMAIGNGQDASQKYLDFMQGKLSPDETEKLWRDLTEYCGLDTRAMKVLADALHKKIME
ncbi:MAG: DUF2779 domain-containing protein [Alphaproteobacteria bacterium]|nr:DUF2779 domain-containing protein [Alphaproteobacteria bacterium]